MIYYPSCKFIAQFPQASKKIQDYLSERYDIKIAGCCKASLKSITTDDTIIYICNTCAAFFDESTPTQNIISVWELIFKDDTFRFPDYAHRRMTVQDCWRSYDNISQQDAVRNILSAMNVEVVELENNRTKTGFCGNSLYEPLPKNYDKLAPHRLVTNAGGFFIEHSQEEKDMLMQDYCKDIETEDVVCYCVACVKGITAGGKTGIHLADLVFSIG